MVSALISIFFLLATSVGVVSVAVSCPPNVLDCSDSTQYSHIFWFPMKFVRSPLLEDQYSVAAWPGLDEDRNLVLLTSFIYWILMANIITLPIYLLLIKKKIISAT